MNKKILIAGASGIVGRAAVEHFASLDDWAVIGLSRRPPEIAGDAELVALDLMDSDACAQFCAAHPDITHVVYGALYEKPGLVAGWRERDQMTTNLTMLRNLMTPLQQHAKGLAHVSLLQGTKAYGVHIHRIAAPARESQPRDDHENFYWLQEDFLREAQAGAGWSFSIFRPQIIFGHALGAPMNLIAAIGAYGAIQREQGLPLAFPGGAATVLEAVDARLLARAFEWAATSPQCAGEIFNITNGDVFCWPDIWPAIAEALGMEAGAPEPLCLHQEMPKKAAIWERAVEKHGLRRIDLGSFVGDSFVYADFAFAFGAETPPPPALLSTIKARKLGFADCIDTEEMFAHWFGRLQREGYLPKPA